MIINGMEDYLKTVNKKSHENPLENSFDGKEASELKNDKNFIEKLEKLNFNVPIDKRKKIKKTNMMLWISEEFPMKFKVERGSLLLSELFRISCRCFRFFRRGAML